MRSFREDDDALDRRLEAEARAEALLLEHLDERQRADWRTRGEFRVVGASGTEYVLSPGSVTVPAKHRWYCLQPEGDVPQEDAVLARKLWLEADEAGFLAAANEFVSHGFGLAAESPASREMRGALSEREREHMLRREELERDFQQDVEDLEREYQQDVDRIYQRYHVRVVTEMMDRPNCRCSLESQGSQRQELSQAQRDYLAALECSFNPEWRESYGGQ